MRLKEIQNIFHIELDALYGKEEVDGFFYLLTDEFLGMKRLALSLQPEFVVTKEEEQPLFEALSKLKLEYPIQYILGKTEFYGLPFKVNGHTLIPRPETEELVALVVQDSVGKRQDSDSLRSKLNILDIGTGSGCIAISLAKTLSSVDVFALDVSSEALKVARQNAILNEATVTFMKADILNRTHWELIQKLPEGNAKFDIIVSNPPYVRNLEKAKMKNNVLNNEPSLALFVEDDKPLVFYGAIAAFASQHLKVGGKLYFEINQYLGEEMMALMESFKFKNLALKKDLFSNDRMVVGTFL